MASVLDRFSADIALQYSLVDRIRVKGHIRNMQSVSMLRSYFEQTQGVSWIEPRHLRQLTVDFVEHVEHFAERFGIPLLAAKPGESHVQLAAQHLAAVADRPNAVYCIIKVQEDASSFVSYLPRKDAGGKPPKDADPLRKIARGQRRVNHYYFFIKDQAFGVGNSIRLSSYAPFTATACLNGHHFVAQQLANRGVACERRDNLFVSVGDPKAFEAACQAFTPKAIARFLDRWVYRFVPHFPPRVRERGFAYEWFLDQVERCHNAIFHSTERLNALFGRLLDLGRELGQPHVISRLFQRKRLQAQRTGGRMQRTRQEDYCMKAWHRKTNIKQYNKQGAALRTETTTYDVTEFNIKKGLKHLPRLLKSLDHCNRRLLRWEDTIDQTTVSAGFVERLGQPTVCANGRRVPGLKLDQRRLYWILAAVLQFSLLLTGFRVRELQTYIHARFGLSPEEYPAGQLRYDLAKLRAKGFVQKLAGRNVYVLTPKGIQQGTAISKLNQCLNAVAARPLPEDRFDGSPQTAFQRSARRVRASLQQLLEHIGLAT